jgi:hypothetical protein
VAATLKAVNKSHAKSADAKAKAKGAADAAVKQSDITGKLPTKKAPSKKKASAKKATAPKAKPCKLCGR